MAATYSLADVASDHLPAEWTDGVRWLARRLNRGELRGYRVGRIWRMRDSDIDYMLERYSNDGHVTNLPAPQPQPELTSIVDGISRRSQRRVRRPA